MRNVAVTQRPVRAEKKNPVFTKTSFTNNPDRLHLYTGAKKKLFIYNRNMIQVLLGDRERCIRINIMHIRLEVIKQKRFQISLEKLQVRFNTKIPR